MFILAEHLHKTIAEIEQITIDEWHYWLAYFKIKKARGQNSLRKQ
nr:hypothetical protein [Rickettsia endosymbiont of Ceutorhynchus assimilis]